MKDEMARKNRRRKDRKECKVKGPERIEGERTRKNGERRKNQKAWKVKGEQQMKGERTRKNGR